MNNFFDRFKKPDGGGGKNLLNAITGKSASFQGSGQSLGGSKPGKVIPIELKEKGSLGVGVEKRPGTNTSIVSKVVPGSQAEAAGLQRGDILCFAGSNGVEEIPYDMFIELAKSDQRPLCFEARRVPSTKSSNHPVNDSTGGKKSSADAYARKQAVIAAAEAREKASKAKSKPIVRKTQSSLQKEQQQMQQRAEHGLDQEPLSEAAKAAIEAAKQKEAQAAAELGYNPYETNRATAGQARNATVAMTHGTITAGDSTNTSSSTSSSQPMAPLPTVAPPTNVLKEAEGENVPVEFASAFETLVTANNDHAAVVSSISIMRKLLSNAITKDDAKFRRVRLGNPKIKAAIVDLEGAIDLMLVSGFHLTEDEGGESVLIYQHLPTDKSVPGWLPAALKQMEDYENS